MSSFAEDLQELGQIFTANGWRTRLALSAEEGIEHLRQHQSTVALFDHEVRDCNWRQFLLSVLRHSPRTRLIVTSARADEALWAEVLNLGGYDVLAKPFRGSEVLRASRMAHEDALGVRTAAQQTAHGAP